MRFYSSGGGLFRSDVNALDPPHRLSLLLKVAWYAAILLLAKTLLAILLEYRWYFPPDFDASSFLTGRHHTFIGVYRAAFYTHIIGGPIAIVLGAFLMLSGSRRRPVKLHRSLGKVQILVVALVVTPTGLMMATQAHAGPVAGWGFAALSTLTAWSAIQTVRQARLGNITSHQRWATRCFVLVCSPLLLRLGSGAFIVTHLETDTLYRVNAWLSWIVPLAAYELWRGVTTAKHFSPPSGEGRRASRKAFP